MDKKMVMAELKKLGIKVTAGKIKKTDIAKVLTAEESKKSLKPPKKWWDKMVKSMKENNPEYTIEMIRKTIGNIWYNKLTEAKRKSIRERFGLEYGAAAKLAISSEKTDWDKLLDALEGMDKNNDALSGVEEFANFVAQIWNGGVEQYIDNGYIKEIRQVKKFLGKINKPACNTLLSNIEDQELTPSTKNTSENEDFFDAFDDEFYRGLDKEVVKEALEYVVGTSARHTTSSAVRFIPLTHEELWDGHRTKNVDSFKNLKDAMKFLQSDGEVLNDEGNTLSAKEIREYFQTEDSEKESLVQSGASTTKAQEIKKFLKKNNISTKNNSKNDEDTVYVTRYHFIMWVDSEEEWYLAYLRPGVNQESIDLAHSETLDGLLPELLPWAPSKANATKTLNNIDRQFIKGELTREAIVAQLTKNGITVNEGKIKKSDVIAFINSNKAAIASPYQKTDKEIMAMIRKMYSFNSPTEQKFLKTIRNALELMNKGEDEEESYQKALRQNRLGVVESSYLLQILKGLGVDFLKDAPAAQYCAADFFNEVAAFREKLRNLAREQDALIIKGKKEKGNFVSVDMSGFTDDFNDAGSAFEDSCELNDVCGVLHDFINAQPNVEEVEKTSTAD